MQNELLGNILNNIVMEKAVRDKIIIQQKEQRLEEEAKRKKLGDSDDEFDDEETRKIMARLKNQHLQRVEEQKGQKEFKRTVGEYREITETEFLDHVTKFNWTIVHFYHKEFERCKIMDKHLRAISYVHPQSQFLYIDAEKAPFFVNKLHIRTLPTVCMFVDGKLKDKVVGFEGLSGDQFKTAELVQKFIRIGVIKANEDEKFKITKGSKHKNSQSSEGSDLE